jgi:hypothetical protein
VSPDLHSDVSSLAFLLGTWDGGGDGEYPSIEPFRYGEQIRFEHAGDPFLIYSLRSWSAHDDAPLHFESGFLRPGSNQGEVELTLAHPLGLTEVSHGRVEGTRLELRSTAIARTGTGSAVAGLIRRYSVDGDVMNYDIDMSMDETPMSRHLTGRLRRAGA